MLGDSSNSPDDTAGPSSQKQMGQRRIAMFSWGLCLEDFLQIAGLTLDDYCNTFTGSWSFDVVEALRSVEVECVLVKVTQLVNAPERRVHCPTGAVLWLIPPPWFVRKARARRPGPWPRSVGQNEGRHWPMRLFWRLRLLYRDLVAYGSTPLLGVARLLQQERCEAMLVQEYEFPRFDILVFLGALIRIPVFGIFQGGRYQRWWLERLFRKVCMHASSGLIVGPTNEADRLIQTYKLRSGKVHRIPNPVQTTVWHPLSASDKTKVREELGLPSKKIVVWHGRVQIVQKGLDVLVEAWERVARSCPDAHLLLMGTGEDYKALEDMLEQRRFGERVTWIKTRENNKSVLARRLACADIYVFPSRSEGFPMAVIEAAACGLPVVATAASGVAEILGPEQTLLPIGDPDALAQALCSAINAEDLSIIGQRLRTRAVSNFDSRAVGMVLRNTFWPETR
jgi:glycosyltransferase involved in cell wall biosynthesis